MVQHDDAEVVGVGRREQLAGPVELVAPEAAGLLAPRANRVQADDEQPRGARNTGSVVSQWRSKRVKVLVKRVGTAQGMSWFPGTASTGGPRSRRSAAACSC